MPDFSVNKFMQKADGLGSLARKHKFTVEIIKLALNNLLFTIQMIIHQEPTSKIGWLILHESEVIICTITRTSYQQ